MFHSRLPWLTKAEKQELESIIKETIVKNLRKHYWGNYSDHAADKSVITITDYRGLMMAIGTLKYKLHLMNTGLLYRGQTKDFELKPSIYRGCELSHQFKANEKWLDGVISGASDYFDPIGNNDEREALLQHYGCPTRWLDVIDHIQTALWFAYHRAEPKAGEEYDDSVGFIYMIGHPVSSDNKYTITKDLRHKPADWIRPHIQQGYSIRSKDPSSYEHSHKHLRVATFVIPRELLKKWSNSDFLDESVIYPGPAYDKASYYWEKTKKHLTQQSISHEPPHKPS